MGQSFLGQSTQELLALFAAGRNTPGAGSAAALAGAIAGGLLETVARHTIKAKSAVYDPFRERAEALLAAANERSSRLRGAVDEDAAAFERFWQARTEETLRNATEVPLAIAEDCFALAEIGIELYDRGFRNARGEAGAAVLSSIANGEAAAHCVWINLQFAGAAPWAKSIRNDVGDLRRRLRDLRAQVEARIYDQEESR